MAAQEKINKYNLADLKATTDDAIPNYLNSLHFRQSHGLADVRLALGYSALILAGACCAWEYRLGFEATRLATGVAVLLYAALNGALTLWLLFVERGIVYVGTAPGGRHRITIASETKKGVPEYELAVTIEPVGGAGAGSSSEASKESVAIKRPFTDWFDEAGHFVALPFQRTLAGSVAIIGKADPARAGDLPSGGGDLNATASNYTPEILEAISSSQAGATGANSGAAAGRSDRGKRRKARG